MIGTMRDRDYCESKIGPKVKGLRDFAALISSRRVMGVIDEYAGKVINKRFDDAMKEAIRAEKADRLIDTDVLFGRIYDDILTHTMVEFSIRTRMGYITLSLRRYGKDYGTEYHPETKERLDAEKMKGDFLWMAEEQRKNADALERCLTDYDEIVAARSRLEAEIEAFNQSHCYEGMKIMEAYI